MSAQNGDLDQRGVWTEEEKPIPLILRDPLAMAAEPPSNGSSARPAVVAQESDSERGRRTAADFTAERMLRDSTRAPAGGWRRAVFVVSGGIVHPGPSSAELRQRELVANVKTAISGCRKIAFISRKGGVGKTSTCLLTGHTFASYRGDRVVALDGNPDAGTLGHRIRRETTATVTRLLADAPRIERYADIRGYTSQAPTRLEVIAADDDPQITRAIGEEEFRCAIELLERHYNLVCLDTGTGVLESATRGILAAADQIVLVSAPSLDGARAASSTLDWLEENGYRHLVDGAVAVVNAVRPSGGLVDVNRIESHFASRCRAVLRVPWDPHLETGAEASLGQLRLETRQAYLELAAVVGAGFATPTDGRS
jgi:putative peptide zinc metalloprotease protein